MPNATKEYSQIGLTTEVSTASNHRLIQLMLDKCLQHIITAKVSLIEKDVAKKCQSISKAMDIIGYLRVCLNFKDKEAVQLSKLLDSIYEYLERTLLHANMYNDASLLDEAKSRLQDIKSGWDKIK
jgi:flagellar protein FliS